MKKITLFVMAAALCCLAGCSKNTPKGVVKTCFSMLQSEDYDKVSEFVCLSDSEEDPAQQRKDIADLLRFYYGYNGGLKSYGIVRDSICSDSSAIVFMEIEFGNGEKDKREIELAIQDGKWKINLLSM